MRHCKFMIDTDMVGEVIDAIVKIRDSGKYEPRDIPMTDGLHTVSIPRGRALRHIIADLQEHCSPETFNAITGPLKEAGVSPLILGHYRATNALQSALNKWRFMLDPKLTTEINRQSALKRRALKAAEILSEYQNPWNLPEPQGA